MDIDKLATKRSVAKVRNRVNALEVRPAGTGTGGAVDSVFGRTGAVVAATGDYTIPQVTGLSTYFRPTNVNIPMSEVTGLNTYFRPTNVALVQTDTTGLSGYYQSSTAAMAMTRITGLSTYFLPTSGGTMTGAMEAADHGTASTDQVVNVCYGTGSAPTANTTTEGTLWIKYTA